MSYKLVTSFFLLVFVLTACTGQAQPASQPASLAGSDWTLELLNDQPPLENSLPTLSFDAEGRVNGNSSCNFFNGSYQAQGAQLSFGPLASTRRACLEAGLMEQESAYLAALEAAASYRLTDGQLQILDASGAVKLVFAAQDLSLTGKTWHLTMFNDGENLISVLLDSQITLQFQEASASGSGGCNNYQGAFTQDGKTLSFGALAATLMACDQPEGVMEQETAYLGALARVSSYTISGHRLTLFDAEGLIMAEFDQG